MVIVKQANIVWSGKVIAVGRNSTNEDRHQENMWDVSKVVGITVRLISFTGGVGRANVHICVCEGR